MILRGKIGDNQFKLIPIHGKKFMLVEYNYDNTNINHFVYNEIDMLNYINNGNHNLSDELIQKFINNSMTNKIS